MKLWRAYLRQHRLTVLMLVLFTGLFAVSFALYGLPLAAVAYPAGLWALVWRYGTSGGRRGGIRRWSSCGRPGRRCWRPCRR